MAHSALTLRPGVNEVSTPALNEAGISSCQLIRYSFDPIIGGQIQKTGGWQKFFPNTLASIVRGLWAWEDTDAAKHLAVGTQNIAATSTAQLGVITSGALDDITPRSVTDNVTPAAATVIDTPVVVITDATTTGISSYDSVYIETHIAVDGLVLYGLYATTAVSGTTYSIVARDTLGNPLNATSNATTTTVASFATTISTNVVSVTLANHGYIAGDTYPCLVSTAVGGVTVYGNYIVQSVTSTSVFVILVQDQATSSTSGSINGGNARFVYSIGLGATPAGGGYGSGGYGLGAYGVGAGIIPATGTAITSNDWTLDNWGDVLVACPVNDSLFQPVYVWNPLSGDPIATCIPQGPPLNDGIFVAMPQRQIVAWGSTFTGIQDPLLIRWCDVNNYNVWIGLSTNQAGSYRLPRGSRIVGCLQGPQQGFVWTDLAVWTMQYIGQPFVYSFNQVGEGCGMIGRKAAATINNDVYWMGFSQFYKLTEGGVETLPCPVWDVVFQNLNTSYTSLIRTAVNSRFGEIAWYYPSLNSTEVDSYVKYNVFLGAWDYGLLPRSAWIDQSVLGAPIGADPTTLYLQQHETSTDADGAVLAATFTTGWFTVADGEYKTFIDQFWPDFHWGYFNGTANATLNITFNAVDYPGQTPITYGPYAVTQSTTFITPRIRARLISMTIASSDIGSWWRCGINRYRAIPDGKF